MPIGEGVMLRLKWENYQAVGAALVAIVMAAAFYVFKSSPARLAR